LFGYYKSKEHLHCKFLRKSLCVRKSTNLDAFYGEIGGYPMAIHRKIIMFKYWIKILKSPDNSILKTMYNIADNELPYMERNWAYQI
jgi:hypothetical protein